VDVLKLGPTQQVGLLQQMAPQFIQLPVGGDASGDSPFDLGPHVLPADPAVDFRLSQQTLVVETASKQITVALDQLSGVDAIHPISHGDR